MLNSQFLNAVVVACAYLLPFTSHLVSSKCIEVDRCQCLFDDDTEGKGINLNGIEITDTQTLNTTAVSTIFNPCSLINLNNYKPTYQSVQTGTSKGQVINIVENECGNSSSMCFVFVEVKMMNVGSFDQFQFQTSEDGNVSLISNYGGWHIKVNLECDNTTNAKSNLTFFKTNFEKRILEYVLKSPNACLTVFVKHPSSNGWKTFFIASFIVCFLYFAGGMLFKKIMFDASGIEMIPNHLFWINLYSGFRDMVLYCFNGCKHPSPYDRI